MAEYVVRQWYRAPELLFNCSVYTATIDIWSVGCILGEIMTREPLFPGRIMFHQLRLITEVGSYVEKPDSYKSWDFVYVINLYENAELICVSLPPSSFLFLFHKYSDSRELGSIIVTVSFS